MTKKDDADLFLEMVKLCEKHTNLSVLSASVNIVGISLLSEFRNAEEAMNAAAIFGEEVRKAIKMNIDAGLLDRIKEINKSEIRH